MKKTILVLLFLLPFAFLLAGFSKPVKLSNPYACQQDSDCTVKDVRNNCGYYPRCVNKNYEPDPNKPLVDSMICGAPDITLCKCKNKKCIGMQNDMEV